MARYTAEQKQKKLEEHAFVCKARGVEILEEVKNLGDKVYHRCGCGNEWKSTPVKVITKPRCNQCAAKEVGQKNSTHKIGKPAHNRISKSDFQKRLESSNTGRVLVGPFKGMSTTAKFQCLECDEVSKIFPSNALRTRCRLCSGHAKKDLDKHARELEPFRITPVSYKGARIKARYTCDVCQFEWESSPTNLLKEPRCPSCSPFNVYGVFTHVYQGKHYKVRSRGELHVLKILLAKYKKRDVFCDLTDGTPNVMLDNGSVHRPDFYIKSTNTLIEVKSRLTAGLEKKGSFKGPRGGVKAFRLLQKKKICAEAQGFNYKVAITTGRGKTLQLPKGWERLTLTEVKRKLKERERRLQASNP